MSDDLIRRSGAIKAFNKAMDELVRWQMEEWQLGDFSECEFNTTEGVSSKLLMESIKRSVSKLTDAGFTEEQSFAILEVADDCIRRMDIKNARNNNFFRRR